MSGNGSEARVEPRPKRRGRSLLSRIVALVALAYFAIELAVLVPFSWLHWNTLVEVKRTQLLTHAAAARPHIREAVAFSRQGVRPRASDAAAHDDLSLASDIDAWIVTPRGTFRLTAGHELADATEDPPSAAAESFAKARLVPRAETVLEERGGDLVLAEPIFSDASAQLRGEAPEAVLYLSLPLLDVKRRVAGYGIIAFLVGALVLLGTGTLTIYHLRRRFLLPLARIIAADNAARRGDEPRAVISEDVIPDDELGAIMRSRNALIVRMTAAQRSLDEKNAELERQRAELAEWGRQLERLVREKSEELVAARESLYATEKLAALGRLSAGVAHEINNPLASIAGYAEELRDLLPKSADPEVARGLKVIEEQAFRCKEILKRLLGLARTDKWKLEPLDLAALLRDTARLCEPSAKKKGVSLEVLSKPGEGPVITSDTSSLQQVVLNLIENAIDAAAAARETRGGERRGRVVVSAAQRSEGGDRGVREIALRVADDGLGVPESIRDRIFDPFYTTKPVGRGTGLGLAICQSIVERLGGRIEIESIEGSGATFTVVLPHEPPSGPPPVKRENDDDARADTAIERITSVAARDADSSSSVLEALAAAGAPDPADPGRLSLTSRALRERVAGSSQRSPIANESTSAPSRAPTLREGPNERGVLARREATLERREHPRAVAGDESLGVEPEAGEDARAMVGELDVLPVSQLGLLT